MKILLKSSRINNFSENFAKFIYEKKLNEKVDDGATLVADKAKDNTSNLSEAWEIGKKALKIIEQDIQIEKNKKLGEEMKPLFEKLFDRVKSKRNMFSGNPEAVKSYSDENINKIRGKLHKILDNFSGNLEEVLGSIGNNLSVTMGERENKYKNASRIEIFKDRLVNYDGVYSKNEWMGVIFHLEEIIKEVN